MPQEQRSKSWAQKDQGPPHFLPTGPLVTLPPPNFGFAKESDLLSFFVYSDSKDLPPPTPPGMSIFSLLFRQLYNKNNIEYLQMLSGTVLGPV